MNIYSVYTDSSKKESNPILIKQGFSLIAGIFNFAWALYYKMWFIASLTIVAIFLIGILDIANIVYSANIAILFLFGFFASEMREHHAKKKGLELSDIVLTHNEEEAEVRYYMRINNKDGI